MRLFQILLLKVLSLLSNFLCSFLNSFLLYYLLYHYVYGCFSLPLPREANMPAKHSAANILKDILVLSISKE